MEEGTQPGPTPGWDGTKEGLQEDNMHLARAAGQATSLFVQLGHSHIAPPPPSRTDTITQKAPGSVRLFFGKDLSPVG